MQKTIDLSRHDNLSQLVYQELLQEIMGGAWKPSEQISVRTQAERFCVSTTPVRDALLKLRSENILLSERRSFRIPPLTREEFAETRLMRVALETLLSRQAAMAIDKDTMRQLTRLHEQLLTAKRKRDFRTVMDVNRQFHFTLYELARMPHALSIVRTLWARTGPYQHGLYLRDEGPREENHDHLRVLEGLRNGDVELVAQAIADDITLRSVKFEAIVDR